MTKQPPPVHPCCPKCGNERIAELVYDESLTGADGQLPPAIQEAVDAGVMVLAGCEMECDSPEYQCTQCGYEW
jgi:predicted RNA-binding Zn-ribbon protein involved in translation (DUF1610 family)